MPSQVRILCAILTVLVCACLYFLHRTAAQINNPGTMPSGMLVMMVAGSCPSGFTESSAMNGMMPEGTLSANGDVGGSGGSNTYTPSGTNSAPTFTGTVQNFTSVNNVSLLAAGVALTGPTSITPAGTVSAPAFTGTAADIRPAYKKVIFCQSN